MIREGLAKLIEDHDLSYEESREAMMEIMSGKTTDSQIAAFLTALRMKGESIEEIAAFAEVMREYSHCIRPKVSGRLLDTCGTGGDGLKTFNVSTAAAFVVAGAGIAVAKHGNRSVTSRCGSADVLEHLGFNLTMGPDMVKDTIEQAGIGFMFAPVFHPAMKYAIVPRKEIGVRTVFNVLGPLTNPACANVQLLGVYEKKLVEPIAYVLKALGCQEAMVVHGLAGLDEVSTVGKTRIAWLKDRGVSCFDVVPEDFGINQNTEADLKVLTPEESTETVFRTLFRGCGANDPKQEIVLANSAIGIMLGGEAEDFIYGMEVARKSIDSGAAYGKLKKLIRASRGDLSKLEELESKYA